MRLQPLFRLNVNVNPACTQHARLENHWQELNVAKLYMTKFLICMHHVLFTSPGAGPGMLWLSAIRHLLHHIQPSTSVLYGTYIRGKVSYATEYIGYLFCFWLCAKLRTIRQFCTRKHKHTDNKCLFSVWYKTFSKGVVSDVSFKIYCFEL